MTPFNGRLNSNEVFAAIYNMIISQHVFADNIKGTYSTLVDMAREDGTLLGDTKLYYYTDALESVDWNGYDEAGNLLAIDKPPAPVCQSITLDKFRQIRLTVDDYLSKRAYSSAGAFNSIMSVFKGWMQDTKRIYDSTTYNAYIGTTSSATGRQNISIPLSSINATGEELNRLRAQTLSKGLADLVVDMKDVSRDFNDLEFLRSYSEDEIKVIWNSDYVNEITKLDLPTIFHKDGLIDKKFVLPARFFGNINEGATAGNGTTVRSLIEQKIGSNHYFPGDLIKSGDTAPEGTSYTVDKDVICKIYTKLPPYMSSFEVGTSFFNPRSLTENHYITFGRNTLEYLKGFPVITVKEA